MINPNFCSHQSSMPTEPIAVRQQEMHAPTSIFCKGLAKGISERCVASIFQRFGNVVECQIARHRSGRSAGFAIVSFPTHEQARNAQQTMDGANYMGRKLSVRWYQPEREGAQPIQDQNNSIPSDTSAQHQVDVSSILTQPALSMEQIMKLQSFSDDATMRSAAQNSLEASWMSVWAASQQQQQDPHYSDSGLGQDQGPSDQDGVRRWSSLVNHWLSDYLHQDPNLQAVSMSDPGALLSSPPTARRTGSFDGGSIDAIIAAAPTAVERRRSTRDSLSRCLDSLHLADSCESPSFLAKSRLVNKWSTGGAGIPSNGGAVARVGARPSDEFHVLADIKLMSPRWTTSGPTLPSSNSAPFAVTWGEQEAMPASGDIPSLNMERKLQSNGNWGPAKAEDKNAANLQGNAANLQAYAKQHNSNATAGYRRLPPTAVHNLPQQQQSMGMAPIVNLDSLSLQLQQWQVIQQAQEQYANAMKQLSSAQNQMLAAAVALQGAGMRMPQEQMPLPPIHVGCAFPPKSATAAANAYAMLHSQGVPQMF